MSKFAADHQPITPRLIRLRDAPFYIGMDRNRFNAEVRPYLVEIQVGKQGIAFDRLDLDVWVDQYKSRNGRPARQPKGENAWGENECQDSENVTESGTSMERSSADGQFIKLLEKATSKRRKPTSRGSRKRSRKKSVTASDRKGHSETLRHDT